MEQITEYEKPWTTAYAAVHGLFILRLRSGEVLRRIFEAVTDEFVRLLGDVCKIIYVEAVESALEYPELNGNTRRAQRLDIALCLRKKRVYAANERERRRQTRKVRLACGRGVFRDSVRAVIVTQIEFPRGNVRLRVPDGRVIVF